MASVCRWGYFCLFKQIEAPWHECSGEIMWDALGKPKIDKIVFEERDRYGFVTDLVLRQLTKTSSLNTLSLTNCVHFSERALAPLIGMKITDLHINSCKINNEFLSYLAMLPLEKLSLEQCEEITNEGIKHLDGLPLINLKIANCSQIGNVGLKKLNNLALSILNVDNCPLIGDGGLLHMLSRFKIIHLSLTKCKITIDFFIGIKNSFLKKLDLYECNKFDFSSVTPIKCDSLESLNLRSCASVSAQSLNNIKFDNLRELVIRDCPKIPLGEWVDSFSSCIRYSIKEDWFNFLEIHTLVQYCQFLPFDISKLIIEYAKDFTPDADYNKGKGAKSELRSFTGRLKD